MRTHIGYGSPRQDNYLAHGEPLGPENVKKSKEELGWPLEPDFYVPDDVLAFFREVGAKGARARSAVAATYDAWKTRQPRSRRRSSSARCAATLPAESAVAGVQRRERQRRDARRRRHGDERDRAARFPNSSAARPTSIRPRRPISRTAAISSRTTTPGATSTTACASTRWRACTNGIALHGGLLPFAATFFNFVDYLKPAVRLGCLTGIHSIYVFTHDSVFLGEDGPTHEPIEQLAMLRATPNCYVVRPADSLETLEAWKLAVAAKGAPWVLVLTRQKLPFLGARDAAVGKRRLRSRRRRGRKPRSHLDRDGFGSLAGRRREEDPRREGRAHARRLDAVLGALRRPAAGVSRRACCRRRSTARMSIEAGATLGWSKYVGDRGFAFGIDRFGASAPAAAIAKAYGFTPDNVADFALATVRTRRPLGDDR